MKLVMYRIPSSEFSDDLDLISLNEVFGLQDQLLHFVELPCALPKMEGDATAVKNAAEKTAC